MFAREIGDMLQRALRAYFLMQRPLQGPRNKFSSGGGGAKEECVKEFVLGGAGGGNACGFLFNFSKVTENAVITIKLLIFFPHLQ